MPNYSVDEIFRGPLPLHLFAPIKFLFMNYVLLQLINHGVCDELIEKMKSNVEEFFQLPLEEKMAYAQLPNSLEGFGQAFVVSEEQKLDWGDMLFLLPRPISQRSMRFWPTQPTAFR